MSQTSSGNPHRIGVVSPRPPMVHVWTHARKSVLAYYVPITETPLDSPHPEGGLMAKLRFFSLLIASLVLCFSAASGTPPRPLRQTEFLALVAGNALPEN